MRARFAALLLCLSLLSLSIAPAQTRRTHARRRSTATVPQNREQPPRSRDGFQLDVPAPSDVRGFTPGDDRKLASWASIVDYFRKLDAASERVKFEELGKTTLGRPFVLATISAPENLARLDVYKDIQRRLADPRTLGRGARAEVTAEGLISSGKTVVLITCGIHSTEVGGNLVSMLIAHRLASSDDAEVRSILQNCIVLLVPSLNPDGVDIVKNWYDKTLGTPYEGTSPPELYHKYTGHDNNRDWYAFTQVETQLTVDKIHNVWHPQIVHDIHQQGDVGSRIFLPPYMKPVEPNVPPQIVAGYTELGNYMAAGMRAAGFKGITTDSTYDAWTPARAYSHYHGGVRILQETASVRLATPITLKFSELRSREGYDPQKESANFGPVWPGGEWHLRDIVTYMDTAAFLLLRHAAEHRQEWLQRFYEIGKDAVRPRKDGELFAYVIPAVDNSGRLIDIFARAGVEVDFPGRFTAGGRSYPQGTAVVRMAQPYGGFAKALLESQHYPDLRDAHGQPIPPYDVTAHTLSLLMNVPATPISTPFALPRPRPEPGRGWNGGCGGPSTPRYALYKSHVPTMDEGWTRWALDTDGHSHCLFYQSLEDAEVRAGNLHAKYDAIIIPDQAPRTILNGYRAGTMPPELTGGLGEAGVRSLREFVEAGGTLIALNDASDFAIEQFKLPVRDITEGLKQTEYYAPGSILRTEIDTSHPVAKGMPRESIAWVENSPVFEFDARDADRVHVIARYPIDHDPLLSGWLLGGRKLWGKSALLEVTMGKGHIYLFGFRPQYRGQSLATYPLLFNALRVKSD
jgi:Zinc carboxypeptidase